MNKEYITVIAPSSNLKKENEEIIQKSINKCQKLGLKVKKSKYAYSSTPSK